MKTIKDAYEALNGDLSNSYCPQNSDKYLHWCQCARQYICTKSNPSVGRQYICTVEEFNNYKGDTVKDKMIPFCLEKALAGEKVVTRDGREVTQLVKFETNSGDALYGLDVENDHIEQWIVDGRYHDVKGECGGDLFMAPKMLSGFINHYYTHHPTWHNSEGQAAIDAKAIGCIKACIDLSQFEEGYGL